MENNNKYQKTEMVFCCVNIAVALCAGALIYIYVKPDSYFGNIVCLFFSVKKVKISNVFLFFLKNWGGDFLWSYALFFTVFLYNYNLPKRKTIAVICAFVCSVFVELLQLLTIEGVKCGTFDIVDILIGFIAIIAGLKNLYCFEYICKMKGEKYG